MYKKFIIELLTSKKSKAYTLMVDRYRNVMMDLKPTLFRIWIADELGIPADLINQSSLNSAYRRLIKLPANENKKGENKVEPASGKGNSIIQFKFSNPDDLPKENGITEL